MKYLIKDPLYRGYDYSMFLHNGFKLIKTQYKTFPDGEIYIRFLDSLDPSGDYYILLRGYPNQNSSILFGEFLVSTLIEKGASNINIIMPYFPYARQDKEFMPGEIVSARILEKIFYNLGANRIFTIDVHNSNAFLGITKSKFINLSSLPLWERYLRMLCDTYKKNLFLIAPDKGRIKFVETLAKRISVEFTYFIKKRDLNVGNIILHEPAEPEIYERAIKMTKCIVIIDDIIATGGTLASLASKIRNEGFKGQIIVGGTHGLFLNDAVDRLYYSGVNQIVTTDTVENPFISEILKTAPIFLSYIL